MIILDQLKAFWDEVKALPNYDESNAIPTIQVNELTHITANIKENNMQKAFQVAQDSVIEQYPSKPNTWLVVISGVQIAVSCQTAPVVGDYIVFEDPDNGHVVSAVDYVKETTPVAEPAVTPAV